MADAVGLRTKVYLPLDAGSDGYPSILYRTPYRFPGDYDALYDDMGAFYAGLGFAMVLQDCRGTNGSAGTFYPLLNEHEIGDGRATVAWIIAQPWSNGAIATMGASYEAYAALAAAIGEPAVKAVIADEPPSGVAYWLDGGIPSIGVLAEVGQGLSESEAFVVAATNALELHLLDQELLGRVERAFQDQLAYPAPDDAFWAQASILPHLGEICAPVLLTQGQSPLADGPLQVAQRLWADGCQGQPRLVHLVLGHFPHGLLLAGAPYGVSSEATALMFQYLDALLLQRPVDLSSVPRIQVALDGQGTLTPLSAWPPPDSVGVTFYFHDGSTPSQVGTLAAVPPDSELPSLMVVDPAHQDPCDYLDGTPFFYYESEPFTNPLAVVGHPTATLFVSSSAYDADFILDVFDYDPQLGYVAEAYSFVATGGLRARYREGFDTPQALIPDEVVTLSLTLSASAWEFRAGHRMVVLLSGAMCGNFENPHTAEPLTAQTQWLSSTHRLHHDGLYPSALVLPTVSRAR